MAAKKRTIRTIPKECTPMAEQRPLERARNFSEVACGYSLAEAMRESERCLFCPDEPCIRGCPVGIDIPGFIQKIGEKDLRGAYDVLTDTTRLPFIEPSGFKVGVVGSGPAGMACAADMAKAGCSVTVFEAFQQPGGVLRYGIPDFRLPNEVVDAEIEKLTRLGIKFRCNTLVGRLFTIAQMVTEMGFDAVFVGVGAGTPTFADIPGESLNGVIS